MTVMRMLRPAAAVALLWAAAACATASPAPPTYSERLAEAEAVRSANPAKFEALLGELTRRIGEAAPRERDQLAYLKAYQLGYSGRFDLAATAATRLFESSADVDLRVRAGSLVVNSKAATRDFTEGLLFLDRTMALVDQVRSREVRHHAWSAAGVIYNQVGQFELGRQYAELILGDGVEGRTACFAGTLRLEALGQLHALPDEPATITAVIEQCLASGERVLVNFARIQLANHRLDREGPRAALAALEPHLPEIESTRYPRLVGEVHSMLAQFHFALGRTDAAESHARKAIANSAGIANSLPLVMAHKVLYDVAMKRQDDASALEQYRLFAEADKAFMDTVKTRELAYQLARHETLEKSRQIELLANQNRVLQLEQEVAAKTAQATRLLVLLMAVLLAFIGYFAWKTKKTQVSFRRLAETDALTGASNRHHFSRLAAQALDYARRSGSGACLVMFDLDEFKAINDRFGHAVGDWVLQQVAASSREACRKQDLFGRIGGEEFAFLLVGADADAGREFAEQCRRRLAAIDTAPTGHRFRVSASFGVAGSGDGRLDFYTLLVSADAAMYAAKRGGRDRVALHEDSPGP